MENQAEHQNQMDSQINSTPEATSQKTPSSTRTVACPEHGDYEAKVIMLPFLQEERVEPCPKCSELRAAEYKRQETARLEESRRWKIKEYRDMCGVPPRFTAKTLDNLQFKTPAQKNILKGIKNYLQALIKSTSASLILCGKPGTAKTHIGCALVMGVVNACKSAQIVTTANLMRQVKATYSRDSEETEEMVFAEYGGLDLLVIDEVGVQFGTETEKLIFYEIIDRRYNNMLPTVLISNLTADELCTFIGERAFDRFKEDGGAILAFDWESYRK